MSATPRTDSAAWIETNAVNAVVLASFARQLERENAQLRVALERLKDYVLADPMAAPALAQARAAIAKAQGTQP